MKKRMPRNHQAKAVLSFERGEMSRGDREELERSLADTSGFEVGHRRQKTTTNNAPLITKPILSLDGESFAVLPFY